MYLDILKAMKRKEARAEEKTAYGGKKKARMTMANPTPLLA